MSQLAVIIEHFRLFPLLSSKRHAFHIFTMIYDILKAKIHLTREGFLMAIALINILNQAVSAATLAAITNMHGPLPSLVLAPATVYTNIVIQDVWWILGFVCGEGSFSFIKRSRTTASGELRFDFSLIFEVSQAISDNYLLVAILNSIGFGSLYTSNGVSRIRITSLPILQHFVLPFFSIYPLVGFKRQQYDIWLQAVTILMSDRSYSSAREQKLIFILSNLTALLSRCTRHNPT
jgi:hypothetical protein